MIPHSIRLREPWESAPAENGHVTCSRSFNRPTNLDPWERVTLEIDRAMVGGDLTLNGTTIGILEPGEYFAVDITALLQPANRLEITVDPATALTAPPPTSTIYAVDPNEPAGSPIGDVRLVIRTVHPSE